VERAHAVDLLRVAPTQKKGNEERRNPPTDRQTKGEEKEPNFALRKKVETKGGCISRAKTPGRKEKRGEKKWQSF